MKALSLTRPWPELIIRCGKRIENRTWAIGYRGDVLLHAARSWSPTALDFAEDVEVQLDRDLDVSAVSPHADDHPTGIVGIARLVNICTASTLDAGPLRCDCGPWAMPGQCHWQLANVRPIGEPVSCPGALGLWTPPDYVVRAVFEQLAQTLNTAAARRR